MARQGWQEPDDDTAPRVASRFVLPSLTKAVRRLLIANAIVFLASFLAFFFGRMSETPAWEVVFGHLQLRPEDWRALLFGLPVWQLFTYGFLHDVHGIGHVLQNMLMLYFFGTMLEALVGTRRFVLTYFGAMVVGALVYLVPALVFDGAFSAAVIGASGACMGVMVAAAALRPRAQVIFIFIPLTLRTLALIFVAYDLFDFLVTLATNQSDGVAHLVHLGGVAYGFLAVRSGFIGWDPVDALARRRAVARVERDASDDARMDQLLEKIHREGMSALSRSEREFLKRMSARR